VHRICQLGTGAGGFVSRCSMHGAMDHLAPGHVKVGGRDGSGTLGKEASGRSSVPAPLHQINAEL
jgi:hypothetical protein